MVQERGFLSWSTLAREREGGRERGEGERGGGRERGREREGGGRERENKNHTICMHPAVVITTGAHEAEQCSQLVHQVWRVETHHLRMYVCDRSKLCNVLSHTQ